MPMLPLFDGFDDAADVFSEFGMKPIDGVDIRIAIYDRGHYEGSAIVIYRSPSGQLYEVNESHCSCHGLEDWNPEKTTIAALRMRGLLRSPMIQVALGELEEEVASCRLH